MPTIRRVVNQKAQPQIDAHGGHAVRPRVVYMDPLLQLQHADSSSSQMYEMREVIGAERRLEVMLRPKGGRYGGGGVPRRERGDGDGHHPSALHGILNDTV